MQNWLNEFWKIERSRRLSIVFGFLIFVGIFLVGLGIMASIKVTPYRTYANRQAGFSIKFPANWTAVLKPDGGAVVAFVSPRSNHLDTIQDNINVSIKILPQAMTLQLLSNTIVDQVTGTFGKQVNISESIPINLGGKPGHRLTFSGYDQQIPNPLQYVTAWTVIQEKVYIITFTGLKKDYPSFEKQVNMAIRSFKFIPVESR